MRFFTTFLLVCAVLLATSAVEVEAHWPHARWRKPVSAGPNGDLRPIFKKFHKQNPPFRPDPNPPAPKGSSKSRQYHFKYGPVFPSHHSHLKDADVFWPADNFLYYP